MSLTAVELGRKIKAKEITAVEAAKAAIEAVKAKEDKVNSFVTVVDEEAIIKRAEAVQEAIEAGKHNYANLSNTDVIKQAPIIFRPEQSACIDKVVKHFIFT